MIVSTLSVEEREFELPGARLAVREWGAPGGFPVIALHGWLDNAGSFDLLAPLLTGCHFLAVDCAGHGLSANRSPDAAYNLWQDVGDVVALADRLDWRRFAVLGHSRGAAIASLLAGTFPDRIGHVVLIEGGVPIVARPEEAPDNLAQAISELQARRDKGGRIFPDRDTAIRERANGFSKVSIEAAEVLAGRSLRAVPGGYQWHADQRLKARSELRLTKKQAAAFLARISAPVLMFLAEESPFAHRDAFVGMLGHFRHLRIERLPGRHHLHLEGAQARIAADVRQFLGLGTDA